MPIQRLERARTSLPEGYQFGDSHVNHPAYDGMGRDRALRLVRSLRESQKKWAQMHAEHVARFANADYHAGEQH